MNYENLKALVNAKVYENTKQGITGEGLNEVLQSVITSLGKGYQFVGVATPTTNPGTQDARVMYLAYLPGTYVNFDRLAVTGFCVLKYNTSWTKEDIPISSSAGGASVTIDSALSSTSTNPVQNKVVKAALDAKQDRMTAGSGIIINGSVISATSSGGISVTVDAALSSTSTNPVQNKAVKAALDAKQDKLTAGNGITINGSKISTTYKIWHGSQAEYDAIVAKDDMTIYLIEES